MNNKDYNVSKNDFAVSQSRSYKVSDFISLRSVLENVFNEYGSDINGKYIFLYETLNNKVIKSTFDYEENIDEDYETISTVLKAKLNRSEIEWGVISEFDEYVIENIQNDNVLKAVNQMYIDNYNNEEVLIKILNAISEIEYDKVSPYGQTIAIASISNKSLFVKQKAIEAFERWHNEESIKILESIDIQEKWLKKHLEKVVKDLKEEVESYA